jgi:hypothetical protein
MIHRLTWLPSRDGSLSFRSDVLKLLYASHGRNREQVLRKATMVLPTNQAWKKGSITIIAASVSRPMVIVSTLLLVISMMTLIVAMVGLRKAATGMLPIVAISLAVFSLSMMGVCGARKRAEVASCLVFSYFYAALALVTTVGVGALWWFAFPASVDVVLDKNWDAIDSIFPSIAIQADNRSEQLQYFRTHIVAFNVYSSLIGSFIALLVRVCSALLSTARLVRHARGLTRVPCVRRWCRRCWRWPRQRACSGCPSCAAVSSRCCTTAGSCSARCCSSARRT